MIPSAFDYAAPQTLEEVLSLLQNAGAGAKALSGGQSLLPVLKLRLAAPERLVDLGKVPGLRRIDAEKDPIAIGAMATHAMIEDSTAVGEVCPLPLPCARLVPCCRRLRPALGTGRCATVAPSVVP